jgi:thiol-disulfide isomerase/thioredoxin
MGMRVTWFSIPILGMAVTALALGAIPFGQQPRAGESTPEFTHQAAEEWVNSPPLSLKSLRGQVVLIDFWTFDCWNCYRSFPWLNEVYEKFAVQGLRIVGVHSPEFDHERQPQRVAAKVREFKFGHPVMIDNDFSYWKALNNQYWPAFYLIDKRGQLRYRFAGETHHGDRRALEIERRIGELITEQP